MAQSSINSALANVSVKEIVFASIEKIERIENVTDMQNTEFLQLRCNGVYYICSSYEVWPTITILKNIVYIGTEQTTRLLSSSAEIRSLKLDDH